MEFDNRDGYSGQRRMYEGHIHGIFEKLKEFRNKLWKELKAREWHNESYVSEILHRASLVAQWLGICLPVQGTQVRALVQEDPTWHEAIKPVHHNCWACTPEPTSHIYWVHVPQLLKPAHLEPVLRNRRSHCNEKPAHHNEEKPSLATTRESLRAATKTQCSQK